MFGSLLATEFVDIKIYFHKDYEEDKAEKVNAYNILKKGMPLSIFESKMKKSGENFIKIHISDREINEFYAYLKIKLLEFLQADKLDCFFSELDDPITVRKCKKIIIKALSEMCEQLDMQEKTLKNIFNKIPSGSIYKFVFRAFYKQQMKSDVDYFGLDEMLTKYIYDLVKNEVSHSNIKLHDQMFEDNEPDKIVEYIFDMIFLFSGWEKVQKIELNDCDFEKMPPIPWGECLLLKNVNLKNNSIDRIFESDVDRIKKHKKIKIDLRNNNFSLKKRKKIEKILGKRVIFQDSQDSSVSSNSFARRLCGPMKCAFHVGTGLCCLFSPCIIGIIIVICFVVGLVFGLNYLICLVFPSLEDPCILKDSPYCPLSCGTCQYFNTTSCYEWFGL